MVNFFMVARDLKTVGTNSHQSYLSKFEITPYVPTVSVDVSRCNKGEQCKA